MLYLAIDIGTTTIKGIGYDHQGKVKVQAERFTQTYTPKPGYSEKDAKEVLQAVLEVVKDLCIFAKGEKEEIGFLSCSAFMHSIFAIDEKGKPLTPCLLWNDGRSVDYAEAYQKNGKGMRIYRHTGTPIHPMSPLYKLMWLRDKEPEVFKKAYKFISIKEYLLYAMTGKYVVDQSIASATGMFNFQKLQWSQLALEEIGLEEERLSEVVETTTILEGREAKFLEAIDYPTAFPIVAGASDGCLANLGSRGYKLHTGVVTMGTSGAVRVVTPEPLIDEMGRTFTYILWKDVYVSGGAVNNGGLVYEWYQELVDKTLPIDTLVDKVIDEKRGLLFLPFLTGERAPYWNARLRGAYLGVERYHNQKDLLCATIEGTCFAIKSVFEILNAHVPKIDILYANGGFTKSKVWLRTLARILGRPVEIFDQGDGACFGAYLLGLKAIGIIQKDEDFDGYFEEGLRFEEELSPHYESLFTLYKEAVKANSSILSQLAGLQGRTEER